MSGYHHRRRPGGAGWGYGQYYGVAPIVPVIENASDCSCKGASDGSGPGLSSLEAWVKQNPMLALIGVFALGYVVAGKKRLF